MNKLEQALDMQAMKDQIPFQVKVISGNTTYTGTVSGKHLQFPKVHTPIGIFEVSWQAVYRAYTNDTALVI